MDRGLGFDWSSLVWTLPALLAVVGGVMILRGLSRLFRGKPVAAMTATGSGALLVACGLAAALLGLNVQTYQRLSYEQPVAEISFRKTGDKAFIATLRRPDGAGFEYDLLGDEWQIEARVLKWKPWANILGFDAAYRLERLTGRYIRIEDEQIAPRTVHPLALNPGLDLWAIAKDGGPGSMMVDAVYGSATFVPMADGASYRVTLSQTGLLARPTNGEAQAALANWR